MGSPTRRDAPSPGSKPGPLGSYRRAFRTFWDDQLNDATEDLSWRWPEFLAVTVATAVALVVALHLVEAFGLGGGRDATIGAFSLAPAMILAAGLIALLGWAYWRSRVDPTGLKAYVVAFLAFAATAGVCLEAFAGANLLLWRQGAVSPSPTAGEPSLWATEQLYAWHLANAVPLVSVPNTIGWREPKLFTDQLSGVLLLTFKLAVLVPLIHLAVSGYRVAEQRTMASRERREKRALRRHASSLSIRARAGEPWFGCGAVALCAAAGGAALAVLASPTSFLNEWLDEQVPDQVAVAGVNFPVSWVLHVPSAIAVVALVCLMAVAVFVIVDTEITSARSLPEVLGATVTFLFLIALLTELAAATTVLLIGVGLASAAAPVPAGGELGAGLVYHTWHTIDAVPGLALPDTLNWSLEHHFVDYWNGAVLLVFKAALIAILAVPVARVIRAAWRRAQPARHEAGIAIAARFGSGLGEASAAIDAYERLLRNSTRGDGWLEYAAKRDANRLLDELEDALVRVTALFGNGAVSEAADGALTSLHARLDQLDQVRRHPLASTREPDDELVGALDRARAAGTAGLTRYSVAAAHALRAACPTDYDRVSGSAPISR